MATAIAHTPRSMAAVIMGNTKSSLPIAHRRPNRRSDGIALTPYRCVFLYAFMLCLTLIAQLIHLCPRFVMLPQLNAFIEVHRRDVSALKKIALCTVISTITYGCIALLQKNHIGKAPTNLASSTIVKASFGNN